MSGISFTDEQEYLPKREPKMEAITNLNDTQEKRNKLISDIIYKKHKPNSDHEWDKLERKYFKYGYQELVKLNNKL
jgi:hypothetical protein